MKGFPWHENGFNFILKAIDAHGKVLIQEVARFKRYKGRPQRVEEGRGWRVEAEFPVQKPRCWFL